VNNSSALSNVLAPFQLWSAVVGVVAGLLCAAGWYFFPAQFFPAYLVAFLFWLGIALGSLAIVMIHHLTAGGWGLPIRRIQEATFINLVLMAVLFLPLLAGLPTLYLWAQPGAMEADEILARKIQYLNVPFFQARAAIYFGIWILLSLALNWLSSGTRREDELVRQRRLALVSGPGLVLWALTVTFAAVDWGMSLEPHWYSSMYGVLFMGGQGVSGLAAAIIAAVVLRRYAHWPEHLTRDRLNDLGNLLLAFVMFWAYVSFMQFLIIWSANLPEETPWYLHRSARLWAWVAIGLAVLHFFTPFLLLLWRQTKRKPQWLVGVAALLLVMRWIDLTWLVMPTFSPDVLYLSWLNFAAPVAIGGLWLAVFAWRLPARAALPMHEVHEEEEVHGIQHAR
jgi:hypothetical protein